MDSIRNECVMNEAGPHVLEEKPLLSPTASSHQILESDETNDPTILDYLNDDCWRVVLDFLPFEDVVRSETVSQRWQGVVLTYLRIVKELRIQYNEQLTGQCLVNIKSTHLKTQVLGCMALEPRHLLAAAVRFSQLTKLELICIPNGVCNQLHLVLDKMPNLETLVLKWCRALEPCHLLAAAVRFSQLKKLELIYAPNEVCHQLHMVLDKMPNLETLVLKRCQALETRHLLAAADRSSQLKKLELIYVPNEVCNQLHLVLDKMPNLEHLRIDKTDWACEIIDDFYESVCRLQRLKHLSVFQNATDKNVADVARCCTELRSLELKHCVNLTVDGLTALCRYAGERLTTLAFIACTGVTANDLVNCILSCPNLTTLNVHHTFPQSQAMAAAAAAARRDMRARTRLRLEVYNYERGDDWNEFDFDISPWIDVNFCKSESDEEDYNSEVSFESDHFIPEFGYSWSDL